MLPFLPITDSVSIWTSFGWAAAYGIDASIGKYMRVAYQATLPMTLTRVIIRHNCRGSIPDAHLYLSRATKHTVMKYVRGLKILGV
jgi:hypothetical protein